MAEKEKQSEHKSTIDKYFDRTAKAYKAWADENEEERNFLQITAETTGDTDEDGNQGFDFHISYHFKTVILANGLAKAMERDEDIRQIIIAAAKMYYIANIKIKDNETDN